MFNEYPYRNIEDLNLDYLQARVRNLEKIVAQFVALESVTFSDPIQWSIASQYAKNVVVLDKDGNAFISIRPVPAGVYLNNGEYWLEIFNFIDYVKSFNSNLTFNIEANTSRASIAYSVGDWLLLDDVLYKVIVAIPADGLFEIGVNIEHFTVEDFIKAWINYANGLIVQYKNDIDASELAYRNQLAQDIANTTSSLQAQLDAAIAGATVDSEVILARVGWDGQTYATLGDAIRSQFIQSNAYMENDILNFIHNVFNVNLNVRFAQEFLEGKGLASAGNLFDDANRIATIDYADVKSVKYFKYHVEDGYRIYIVTYTDKNNVASHNSGGWLTGDGVMQNQNDNYMRVCLASVGDLTPVTSADVGNFTIDYLTDYGVTRSYSPLYRGYSLTPIDFNDYTQIGIYNFSNGVAHTNGPTATGGGTLIVLPTFGMLSTNLYTAAYPAPYLAQILINAADKSIYIRYRSSGATWRGWVSINDMTYSGAIADNTDLDSIYTLGNYSIKNNTTLVNAPDGFTGGSLHVFYSYEHESPNIQYCQMLISPYNRNIWARYCNTAGVWRDWISLCKAPIVGTATKWLAIGDSIVDGVYSYLDSDNNPATGVTTSSRWTTLLSDGLGYDLDVMASRGMGYTVTGQDPLDPNAPRITISELMTRIEALPDDYNLVTMCFGINDYNTSASTIAAIESSFNAIIQRLVTKFPNARVVVMTPFNEARHGDATTTYAYNYAYGGRSLKDVADAIASRCDYYGVECLNVSNGFIFNNFNIGDLQADNVHPTLTGHELIAKGIMHNLLT